MSDAARYAAFTGRYQELMPALLAKGRTPLSVADIMRQRLTIGGAAHPLNRYVHTSDGIAYHPDGRGKVVLDAALLRAVNPASRLNHGALCLDDAAYDALPGTEFRLHTALPGSGWCRQAVLDSPIWNTLARDHELLRAYATAGTRGQRRMATYTFLATPAPALRAWFIDHVSSSDLYGTSSLDDAASTLIGMRYRHPVAPAKGAVHDERDP